MPLAPGTRLGRFEILTPLGQGGMGEVYRARDARLGRDVAIKILSPALHADPLAVGRFEQEARAASALQHPAIVTVFDAGTEQGQPYLVTELLDGATLRRRLTAGALPLREAIDIAIQTADGLGAAHRAGIVHRDIKPENLFLTRKGAIKILDFGIARLTTRPPVDAADATVAATSPGMLMGTAGYMAPEQARGADVDSRADIFAFGCVLHEMLTGQRAFTRGTSVDTIAAILNDPSPELPPPPAVPAPLARIAQRCLQKAPDDRFQSAVDLTFALTSVRDDLGGRATATGPARASGRALAWMGAAALLAAAGLSVWTLALRPGAPSPPPRSLDAQIVVPASARPIAPAISPDGKWLAYISAAAEEPRLLVQFLSGGPPIDLTAGTGLPVLNRTIVGGLDIKSDGSAIGFAGRPGPTGLWSVPGVYSIPTPMGGPPQRVIDRLASLRWSPDGRQIAAVEANPLLGDAIVVANADGQDQRVLVPAGGGVHMHQVAWSPDGRYVYYVRLIGPHETDGEIYRVAATGGPPEVIVRTPGVAKHPVPTPDGAAVIYAGDRNGEGLNIWLHPLDGSPDVRLTVGAGEYTEPFLSGDGALLVCLARRPTGEVVRLDVDGNAAGAGAAIIVGAAASSDGEPSVSRVSDRIFVTSTRGGPRRIWSIDGAGGAARPLTSGDALDHRPVVSPDGTLVAFSSNRGGQRGLWIVAAEGGTPRRLITGEVLDRVSWSAESRHLVYALAGDTGPTLWTIDVTGGEPRQVPGGAGRVPAWSPDGGSIAVVQAEDGRSALHFITPEGTAARPSLSIDPVGVPTAIAWSPDGTRVALVNLPGRTAAEVWVLTIADGALRRVQQFAAPVELDGVAWTRDSRAVLVGRKDYESEVLLLSGLK